MMAPDAPEADRQRDAGIADIGRIHPGGAGVEPRHHAQEAEADDAVGDIHAVEVRAGEPEEDHAGDTDEQKAPGHDPDAQHGRQIAHRQPARDAEKVDPEIAVNALGTGEADSSW